MEVIQSISSAHLAQLGLRLAGLHLRQITALTALGFGKGLVLTLVCRALHSHICRRI